MLISSGTGSTVELYNLINKTSCYLPSLPQARWRHTSAEGILCGGGNTAERTSCVDISSGSWASNKYPSIRARFSHLVWNINPGQSFMIIGGVDSNGARTRTTDILHNNGTIEPGFDLQHDV